MTELMSFEEFLKENEKTAKTYARQYVEGEYRRKYREEARKKNPDLKKNQQLRRSRNHRILKSWWRNCQLRKLKIR